MSLAPIGHPGFVFRGKTYKTIAGLYKALFKDSGADSIGGVSKADTISASRNREVVKMYCITPPVAGQKQYISNAFLPAELDRSRRNSLIASAYNVIVAMRPVGTDYKLPGNNRMSSAGFPDAPRELVMMPAMADGLPLNLRSALLCAYAEVLLKEQQTGQQMIYTFADCQSALKFVNV